ncbi:MAG: carbohydrate-binding family 9-like protein [Candidatus Latescibacteria bacterium]|nr:carbohydrate-binding family 9-like protein [Candidatus Latescibacterota bacterium]
MNIRYFMLLFVLAVPFDSWADVPEYTVKRATEKIVIDGILDESDWASAKSVGDFLFPWKDKAGDMEQTEVKILWDDTFLYISYRCEDKHIWATHFDTNADTYKDDCVEFFWNPDPEGTQKYNMFEFNAIGNMLSVYTGSGESIHERISRILVPHIAQTVHGTVNDDSDTDTAWVLEVAVRFSDYPELSKRLKPLPGDMWRVGLNRCGGRGGQTAESWSMWSPPDTEEPKFHVPDFFGKIFFSDKSVR